MADAVKVTVVQPYVPRYRAALFEGVVRELSPDGIEVTVAAPASSGTTATRGDQALAADWQVVTKPRFLSPLGNRGPTFHSFGARRSLIAADVAVVPAMATCWDSWVALRRRPGLAVGVWGHIGSFTSAPNALDLRLEREMMRRADLVMSYTQAGADIATEDGIRPDRIEILGNTNDTQSLELAARSVGDSQVRAFRARHALSESTPTFSLIGGLDSSKRLEVVRDALDLAHRQDRPIHLLVGGEGDRAGVLAQGVGRGQVTLLGYVDDAAKALMAAASRGILNPGRIGLLAVDALVVGLPIVTMAGAMHAPEVAYLREGVDLFTVPNSDVEGLLTTLLTAQPVAHQRPFPTIEQFIENFCHCIRRLAAERRTR